MEYEFAPLEGITDAVYRRNHARFFPGMARYYTPFISPTQNHRFTPRELRELAPENNPGLTLVPQLLGKNPEDFLWAAQALADMGYDEVNLNLGCPSGTVTAKGKGAGRLVHSEELERFLDAIFAAPPLSISVKTRLGWEAPEEFDRLLGIYARYPIRRLIVHARTRREMYDPGVHRDTFARAVGSAPFPLSFNGDLFTPADIRGFAAEFPAVETVMLGRGLVADPGLVVKLSGGTADRAAVRAFHDALCREYPAVFGSRNSALHRMKAIWHYLLCSLDGGEAYRKRLIKVRKWEDYITLTEEIFRRLPLREAAQGIK